MKLRNILLVLLLLINTVPVFAGAIITYSTPVLASDGRTLTGTHVLTTAYQFSGDGAAILTTTTQYPTSQTTNPAVTGRTTATGTIPQP